MREVVERIVVRTISGLEPDSVPTRPAQRLSGEPYTLPEDALEWIEALAVLRREVMHPKVFPFRGHIARACERTLHALRADGDATQMPVAGEGGAMAE